MDVRLHRFKKRKNGSRKTGQNRGVGKAKVESESDVVVGVTLEVRLHRFKKS